MGGVEVVIAGTEREALVLKNKHHQDPACAWYSPCEGAVDFVAVLERLVRFFQHGLLERYLELETS